MSSSLIIVSIDPPRSDPPVNSAPFVAPFPSNCQGQSYVPHRDRFVPWDTPRKWTHCVPVESIKCVSYDVTSILQCVLITCANGGSHSRNSCRRGSFGDHFQKRTILFALYFLRNARARLVVFVGISLLNDVLRITQFSKYLNASS